MRHPFRWIFGRGVSATDIGYPLFLLWTAIALWHTPDALRARNPLYTKLEVVMPLNAWALVILLLGVGIIGCALAGRWQPIVYLYIGVAAWWTVLGVISYQLNGSWLGAGFFATFVLWALLRQAQIGALLLLQRVTRDE